MKSGSGVSIAVKMTMGYLPLALIIIALSGYTLYSLDKLNHINRQVINHNMAAIETCDAMKDILLAQESCGKKYLILKSEEMAALFSKSDAEFKRHLEALSAFPETDDTQTAQLKHLHNDYDDFYAALFNSEDDVFDNASLSSHSEKIRDNLDRQLIFLDQILSDNKNSLESKTRHAKTLSKNALYFAGALSFLGIFAGVGAAFLITRDVSRAINQLKLAALNFSQHRFDFAPDIHRKDEFGTLAKALASMAGQLAKLKAMDIDTNPLTRLPGGMAVEQYLEQQVESKNMIAFCLFDIDNFKSFNDRYGYARGNQVIKSTGEMISRVVKEKVADNSFVGHIGGDDFVAIIPHDRYEDVCRPIITDFDDHVTRFYDSEDLEKGYIISESRNGYPEKFPIMTLSIAVVTNEDDMDISRIRIGEIAAEIKAYAKTFRKSIYLTDRRRKD